ncbi:MAG: sugar ABC transporter permease [Clostridiaceae bacterium]|jgi:raffinose/stachyose/melibiose transport system permease protein|nr:sugar ABC transporter permease [Clostridiaceae bacterium]
MDSMIRNRKTILLFLLPALLIYLGIVAIPVFSTVYYSFHKWSLVDARRFVGFNNFVQLFSIDKIFEKSMKNTLLLMGLSIVIQVPLAILLATAISGAIRGKRYFKTVYFMPNILASVAVGLLWSFIYNAEFGLINSLLRAVGLGEHTGLWLADEKAVLGCIMVVICWQFIGYHMIIYLAAIENIPPSLNEMATIDGAGPWQRFIHITLPLIRPIIGIDTVLIATGSLRYFDLIYVMSNGGPNHSSEVMALYLYYKSFRDMQYGYGSAIAVVLLCMCLLVTVLLNRLFKSEEVQYY